MEQNKVETYRDFVNNTAPAGYKKEISNGCIGMLILSVIVMVAAPFLELEINWYAQIAVLVLAGLIFFTYLPIFALLLTLLGAFSVIISFITTQSFSGYLILLVGLGCFIHTHKLHKAYKKYREEGSVELEDPSGFISFGSKQSTGTERFTASCPCEHCGGEGLRVIGTKYSRFAFRNSSHNADWRTFCPQCSKDMAIKSSKAKKLALDSGNYTAYKRAEIFDGWLVAFILSAVLTIVAVFLSAFIARSNVAIYSADVQSPELAAGRQFVGEDLYIVDAFAVEYTDTWSGDLSDTESIQALHMMAYFESGGEVFLLPVKVLPDKDLFAACIDYLSNPQAAYINTNVHGYIDDCDGQTRELLQEALEMYGEYYPECDHIIDGSEVTYWDAKSSPNSHGDYKIFNITAAAAGLAAALFFALDRYMNSEARSEKVQIRYDRKHKGQVQ